MRRQGRTFGGGSCASHVESPGHLAIGAQHVGHITLRSFLTVSSRTGWSRIVVGQMERVQGTEGHCHHLHKEGHLLPHQEESLLLYAGFLSF